VISVGGSREALKTITTKTNGFLRTLALGLSALLVIMPVASAETGQWARAVGAFEHGGSDRTSLFLKADPFAASTGDPSGELAADLPGVWSAAIDAKGRVFVQGGVLGDLTSAKPFVSRLDPETHEVLWQTALPMIEGEAVWNYPGGIGVHRNGYVYVAYAARMAKLDPIDGKVIAQLDLPTPNGLANTSYNGFVLLSDGLIVSKSHHRKADCPVQGYRAFIVCGVDGLPPSALVMIDPETMQIVWTGRASELIGGRITATRFGKQEFVYLAGLDKLYRMRRAGKKLIADEHWGPVTYREGEETPGTAAIGFGDFVVIQTNALPTTAPLRLTAFSQADAAVSHSIRPFEGAKRSWSFAPSKASSDWASRRIYTSEAYGGFAALDFDPKRGFSPAWRADQFTGSFITLLGRGKNRVIVASDMGAAESDEYGTPKHKVEDLVWRRASDGKELGRAKGLPRNFGLTLTPTQSGAIYYATGARGLWYVTPPSNNPP
jgi:hypothetical protein